MRDHRFHPGRRHRGRPHRPLPCGVEFRVATDDQLDHLVAAIREHAKGSHDHEVTREQVLAELGVPRARRSRR